MRWRSFWADLAVMILMLTSMAAHPCAIVGDLFGWVLP